MAGEGIYRFLLRMPEELRKRLDDAASASGSSLNREIVTRLEASLERTPSALGEGRMRGETMMQRNRRTALVAVAVLVILASALAALRITSRQHTNTIASKLLEPESQGTENGGRGGESNDYYSIQKEFAEARTAPNGIVAPGAYSSAVGQLNGLATVGGSWSDLTKVPYDADHPAYRDYYSNSSGGSGLVTGRITGLAADPSGNVWAAGADGGVWFKSATAAPGNYWTDITGGLLSLSSGDLEYSDGKLYYATGEANTGGTSYVGAGVYVLANPASGSTAWQRIGDTELESTTIGKLRFGGGKVWAATLRGVWFHDASTPSGSWTLAYAPNPANLPASLRTYTASGSQMNQLPATDWGTSTSSTTNAPYKNIVNDVAVDPADSSHILAAIGWRSGDTYNGFYETHDAGLTWAKINPTGGLDATDVGYVTFAFSQPDNKNRVKLYAINQSPRKLNQSGGTSTYLDGIYVSNTGALAGPWNKIASADKLGSTSSGSALYANFGRGYSPGIQSWYNQFLAVDPTNADHVYAGLEEVYETGNGGSDWSTVGPYWNFYFSCWAPDSLYPPNGTANRCPMTTHPDQHAIAIGGSGQNRFVVVGNDGGVYSRPLNGQTNANHNATDWSNWNDGSIDTLQYYAVGIGKINHTAHTASGQTVDENTLPVVGSTSDGVLVSGGLQDNGGSLLNPNGSNMVSNFGGDGGDVLVDPNDGCNIVQEYVVLSMSVTQTCAHPDPSVHPNAFLDLSQSTTYKIAPPDVNARFIAPFVANKQHVDEWLAGGNSLWIQSNGFAIRSGSEWTKAYTFAGGARVATAVAMNGNTAIASWCGPCNNSGFARGIAIGTKGTDGKWTFTEPLSGTNDTPGVAGTDPLTKSGFPRRYIGGVAVGDDGALYVAVNGFSRRFTEGEGAGLGHVFKSVDKGASWTDISANFPDVPANSIQALSDGSLVVGTDLGVLVRQPGSSDWKRLGTNLPLTVAMDVELGPDGSIYAATHGRGIWSIANPTVATTTTTTTSTTPKKK
ncbi:MAG: Arc family DNA-binding protein [Gaiellaceae bacterium]